MKSRKHIPFYPILISIYPILSLIAFNFGEFDLSEGWRPLKISLIGCIILWLSLRIVIRDWGKSAVITSMFMGMFYSYGHIYNIIKKIHIGDFVIGRHRFLLLVFGSFFIAGIYWVFKKTKDVTNLGKALNWVTIILVTIPSFQILMYEIKERSALDVIDISRLEMSIGDSTPDQTPDIYYIILDAYTRQDTLQAMYGYDNDEFIESLKDLGFYVAECSQSNYPKTYTSLVSSLNMKYVESSWKLRDTMGNKKNSSLLVNNNLRKFLEDQGYSIVAFKSGIYWTEFKHADYYLSYKESSERWLGGWLAVNVITDFEVMLIETTLLKVFEGIDIFDSKFNVTEIPFREKRARILYTMGQLKYINNISGPKFVFVHVLSPHRPFIFGPNGEELIPDDEPKDDLEYAEGYTNQITFINSQILPVLKSIIHESKTPPIIILQGDHGPSRTYGTSSEYRATILNAYYLPDGGEKYLYPDISPVNSFRIVLKHYFNVNVELLEDFHYASLSTKDPDKDLIIQNVGPVCGE